MAKTIDEFLNDYEPVKGLHACDTPEQLMNMFLNEQKEYEWERTRSDSWVEKHPDKYGCYCVFVTDVATAEIWDDFPLIMKAFLKKEFANIDQYMQIRYWRLPRGSVELDCEFVCQYKSILFSAYKQGNEFAKQLWINIFQKYFPDDYYKLTHTASMHYDDMHNMMNYVETDRDYAMLLSKYLVMAEILDVKIEDDCAYGYYRLNWWIDNFEKDLKSVVTPLEISDENYEKAQKWVDELETKNEIPNNWRNLRKRGFKALRFANDIAQSAMSLNGFGTDFIDVCYDAVGEDYTPKKCLYLAKAICEQLHPSVEYSDEQLLSYAAIIHAVDPFVRSVLFLTRNFDKLLGMPTIETDEQNRDWKESNFDERIIPQTADVKKNNVIEKITSEQIKKQESKDYDESEFIKEIERLRNELHKKESQYEYLKSIYAENRALKKSIDSDEKQREIERLELVELRNYLFSLTEEDIEAVEKDYTSEIDNLRKYKVTIIGGHSNWSQKIKSMFPEWKYVKPGISSTVDEGIVMNCDMVYIFSDSISHPTYYKYIGVLRTHNIPFSYIHSVNINNNLKQFVQDLEKWK